eukprot:TRINITY_DN2850_c0_g1_i1.p1 TRINITY_DN2850_c0_g1~~TRINITY_DN2850_c0_g1_i1.p1  ORF type:complete len:412 (-),score=127.11 TRINITY_DN2850_c0_g1_i1:9-1181(-)
MSTALPACSEDCQEEIQTLLQIKKPLTMLQISPSDFSDHSLCFPIASGPLDVSTIVYTNPDGSPIISPNRSPSLSPRAHFGSMPYPRPICDTDILRMAKWDNNNINNNNNNINSEDEDYLPESESDPEISSRSIQLFDYEADCRRIPSPSRLNVNPLIWREIGSDICIMVVSKHFQLFENNHKFFDFFDCPVDLKKRISISVFCGGHPEYVRKMFLMYEELFDRFKIDSTAVEGKVKPYYTLKGERRYSIPTYKPIYNDVGEPTALIIFTREVEEPEYFSSPAGNYLAYSQDQLRHDDIPSSKRSRVKFHQYTTTTTTTTTISAAKKRIQTKTSTMSSNGAYESEAGVDPMKPAMQSFRYKSRPQRERKIRIHESVDIGKLRYNSSERKS